MEITNFLSLIGVIPIAFYALFKLVGPNFLVILTNSALISIAFLLFVSYFNFLRQPGGYKKYVTREMLFGWSVIALWAGIMIFRVYNLFIIGYDHEPPIFAMGPDGGVRGLALLIGQTVMAVAGYLQWYAMNLEDDYPACRLCRSLAWSVTALIFGVSEALQYGAF